MSETFEITRQIGIDAGHRVTNHHSKCRSLHGHRYEIYATVSGQLETKGSTEGMAGGMDFGFIKDEMMRVIDENCDHALILWKEDPLVMFLVVPRTIPENLSNDEGDILINDLSICPTGKLYLIDTVPTAENLAAHWFKRLWPAINERSFGKARLTKITVFETPNCSAVYEG